MANPAKHYYQRWLDKRIPAQRELTLNQRRIFIFPSRQGFYFLIVLLLLLIAAINFQNNLIYLLVFFLASMMNSAILFTYLNVSGLSLKAGKTQAVYAGDYAEFEVIVSRSNRRQYHQISLSWLGQPKQMTDLTDVDQQSLRLLYRTERRGLLKPGRILLESYYPLGFIRCWSWIDLDFAAVVYPKPKNLDALPSHLLASDQGVENQRQGQDNQEFYGFRAYQQGDSLRQISWRSLAKGLPLQSIQFASKEQQQSWVDWQALAGLAVEDRLSVMAGWLLQLEKQQVAWGLRLPNQELALGTGERHKHQALQMLALYGIQQEAR
jgi:uncharacterized protein (DUF58 family)